MANEDQLEILQSGVQEWNAWREENPEIKIDLRDVDLQGANLKGASLANADLENADLQRANLTGADLSFAKLSHSELTRAKLTGADLSWARLDSARLIDATLIEAKLRSTYLADADLEDANLRRADLREATLSDAVGNRAVLSEADLSGATAQRSNLEDSDFENANLRGVNLYRASLDFATLTGASLVGANLTDASLRYTTFLGADLNGASLGGVDLLGTGLQESNLVNADLGGAHLSETNLAKAKLGKTRFSQTTFNHLDLSTAEDLAEVQHNGPSGITSSTLELTAAGLANTTPERRGEVEAFLRGAGVSEHFIDYFRGLIGMPIEFYSAFISYSHADKSFARRLYNDLQARGIRCWLDEKDMRLGDRILDAVNQAIRSTDRVLLCCSLASLTSTWVDDEIAMTFEKEREGKGDVLIPLDLDGYLFDGWKSGSGARVRARLAGNFVGWDKDAALYEKQLERVVAALRPKKI